LSCRRGPSCEWQVLLHRELLSDVGAAGTSNTERTYDLLVLTPTITSRDFT
jgi:hypothetical protein